MIKLGITGGIGSGKSLVCQVYANLGIPVFNSDKEARVAMVEDGSLREALISSFGTDIYTGNEINKVKMAQLIFSSPSTRNKVNSIVHPVVRKRFYTWCESHSDKDILIQEAAILFESGAYKFLDKTLVVFAPEQTRIQRVMSRDGLSEERVKTIMSQQLPEEEKMKRSDYTLFNYDDHLIIPQALDILKILGIARN